MIDTDHGSQIHKVLAVTEVRNIFNITFSVGAGKGTKFIFTCFLKAMLELFLKVEIKKMVTGTFTQNKNKKTLIKPLHT